MTYDAPDAPLADMSEEQIDFGGLPEPADFSDPERRKLYRPIKRTVTIRLDADVIAWFKSRELKYQTAINRVLREHVAAQQGGA